MVSDNEPKIPSGDTQRLSEDELFQIRKSRVDSVPAEQLSLLIYHRDGLKVVLLREGEDLVVGRTPPADIPIRDSTLSRQHARLELRAGEIWVEDLDSTNGTWINDERISRVKVAPGTELQFGGVQAAIQLLNPDESDRFGLPGHESFSQEIAAEVSRARTFGRNVALVMLRSNRQQGAHMTRWFPSIRSQLRSFDRAALYSAETLEILLPETSDRQARELVEKLLRNVQGLLAGIGVYPDHADSAAKLEEVTRSALHKAGPGEPAQVAPSVLSTETDGVSKPGEVQAVITSETMEAIYRTVEKLSNSAIPVLIIGETGTGKELIARALHDRGKRTSQRMLCVNCGSIPSQLIESTLFGHERGAFTGAHQRATGLFEAADKGTILLDEIGELPLNAQTALLRVLETKRFQRVGSSKEIEVDVRVVAATHRDLNAMCREGSFRTDLFYRLNVMTLHIPPLRDRPEEIEPLCRHFIARSNQDFDPPVSEIADSTWELLKRYPWPGNIRELRNVMERAGVIAQDGVITPEDLPESIRRMEASPTRERPREDASGAFDDGLFVSEESGLKGEMQRIEAELLRKALEEHDWDRKATARALGLPLRTLAYKVQSYGLQRKPAAKS